MTRLEIVITHYWTHPHYGGDRKNEYRFKMSDGENAEKKFNELAEQTDKVNEYSHTSISVNRVFE